MSPWKRVYWSVWLANLITSIGMMSFLPFFPSHLEELGLTDKGEIAAWTGVIFGAAPLMAAIMGPVWGSLGDRFGRKPMVLRAQLAIGFFIGCMAFARTPGELLALRLLQGVFSGFVAPSITLVSVVAPPSIQGRVAGSLQTALALGTIVGPLLGAFVASEYGLSALFLGVSAAAMVSALIILVLVREPRTGNEGMPTVSVRGAVRGITRDLTEYLARPELRALFVIVFGVQFAVGMTQPLLELFVDDVWTGDPAWVSVLTACLFAIMAGCDLVFMPLWGRVGDRRGHRVVLGRTVFLTGAALVLHALAPTYFVLVLARLFLGVVYAGVKPCAFGLTAAQTHVSRRGNAVGMVLSARQFGLATSAAIGGLVAGALGLRGLFVAGGLLLFALTWLAARSRSRLASAPSPAE